MSIPSDFPTPLIATIEGEARDCDGKHFTSADYEMEPEELTDQFGDLTFFDRVMCYSVSSHAEDATLRITQRDGLPVFEYSERTDEGYRHTTTTFRKA